MTLTKCGIISNSPDYCREGVEENQEYCILNENTGFCKKKDKRSYDKIIEEIKNKGVAKPISAKKSVAKPVSSKKCGISSSTLDMCREGIDENQEYCVYNEKSGLCNKKDKRTYNKIIEEIRSKIGLIVEKPAEVVHIGKKSAEETKSVPINHRILPEDQDRSLALERYPFDNFRIFSVENDFEDISTKREGKGGYGAAYKTKFKGTGQSAIVKEFTNYQSTYQFNELINDDIIKEITLLQFLNQFPNSKVVGFYGLAFNADRSKVYLVLQPLEKTLNTLWDKTIPPEQLRVIFYQILKAFSNIHGAGVLHNDIKLINMMISREDVRIIDFGLAEYLGVGPTKDLLSNYISTEVTKAPDIIEQKHFGFNIKNRKSYASDMYSIGASIVHLIIGQWYKLLVEGNKIYIFNLKNGKKIKDISNQLKDPQALGLQGYDLLLKIMNTDTHERWCALEALSHPYFSGMAEYVPLDRTILGGGIEKIYTDHIQYSEEEYLKHQMELCYLEIQHQTFMDDYIKMVNIPVNTKKYYLIVLDWLLTVYTTRSLINGLDTFINCIQNINKNWTSIYNKYKTKKMLSLAILSNHLYSSLFNFENHSVQKYIYITDSAFTNLDAMSFVLDDLIIANGAKNPIYPISIHIQYIYLKLKFELKDSRINGALEQLYIGICLQLIYWFIQPERFEQKITNWELAIFCTNQSLAIILGLTPMELNREPLLPFLTLDNEKFSDMETYHYSQMHDEVVQKMIDDSQINKLSKYLYQNSKYFL